MEEEKTIEPDINFEPILKDVPKKKDKKKPLLINT